MRPRDRGAVSLLPGRPRPRPSERPRVPASRSRGGRGAHAQSPTSSGVCPRRGTPRSPMSPSSSSSSSWSISSRTSLVIICMAPPEGGSELGAKLGAPGFRNDAALAGPCDRAGTAGRVWLPPQGLQRPVRTPGSPAKAAADPSPAPKTVTRRRSGAGPLSMPSERAGLAAE